MLFEKHAIHLNKIKRVRSDISANSFGRRINRDIRIDQINMHDFKEKNKIIEIYLTLEFKRNRGSSKV